MKNFDDNFHKDTESKIVHARIFVPDNFYTYLCWDKDKKLYYWGVEGDSNIIYWNNYSRATNFINTMLHSTLFESNNNDFVYYTYDLNSINNQDSRRPLWEIS